MAITPLSYVPVLRWRMGEYQALARLGEAQKDHVTPLFELLNPDYDFEEERPKRDIDAHLAKFGITLVKKWGTRAVLLDAGHITVSTRMNDGRHPLQYLVDEAVANGVPAVPVTTLDRDVDYQEAVRAGAAAAGGGAALRCSLEQLFDVSFDPQFAALLKTLGLSLAQIDLILDLGSPNFDPLEGLAEVVSAALQASASAVGARSTTVIATSFPASMGDVKGPLQVWTRHEWLLFKAVLAKLPESVTPPAFGDFGIASLSFAQGDMRKLKPSANIRYTITDGWLIGKGKSIRDNGNVQFRGICQAIVASGKFIGTGFSPGSEYLSGCGRGEQKTGSSSTWKWVGTNHHITKVVHDLANLSAP